MPVISIAGYGVYEAVAEVDLIVFNVWIWDIEDYFIISVPDAHICTHLAGVTAHTRSGELDACGYAPAFWAAGVQRKPAADGDNTATAGGGQHLQGGYWELWIWLWYRDMFSAELGEAVIGTDKQVIAADMMLVIIRRAV